MAVSQAIPITRHPFANGSYKQMLIDGKWVDAASGKRFETHNPATGELLATVAEGDKEDIDRAVTAARRAFDSSKASAHTGPAAASTSAAPRSRRVVASTTLSPRAFHH